MKTKLILPIVAFGIGIGLYSCKTNNDIPIPSNAGMINVVNTVVGGSTITLSSSSTNIISTSNTVGANAYALLPIAGGSNTITLAVPAVAATATTAAIPAVTYYTGTLTIDANSNYSIFLAGTPSAVDNVVVQESYPRAYSDSTCGVRFINLVKGSNPISVNIKGSANGSEASSLAYKAYSSFNKHAAQKVNPNYVFEFRDAGTGTLLTSYTMTTPYMHNVTLCLRGTTSSYGITLNNDY